MGGIVGALFALGVPPQALAERMRVLQDNSLINLTRWTAESRQRALRSLLVEALEGKSFADLKIPTTLMAVDMARGTEVALREGPLMPAVMATSAVPALFPPVRHQGMQLADGGVIDSLATHVAFEQGAGRVIAVDVEPPLEQQDPWVDPISAITGLELPFLFGPRSTDTPGMFAAMWRAVRVMVWHIHQARLAQDPPDVLLCPPVTQYGSLDFKELDALVQAGADEARRHLAAIRALGEPLA
jgi:NTE family protein